MNTINAAVARFVREDEIEDQGVMSNVSAENINSISAESINSISAEEDAIDDSEMVNAGRLSALIVAAQSDIEGQPAIDYASLAQKEEIYDISDRTQKGYNR